MSTDSRTNLGGEPEGTHSTPVATTSTAQITRERPATAAGPLSDRLRMVRGGMTSSKNAATSIPSAPAITPAAEASQTPTADVSPSISNAPTALDSPNVQLGTREADHNPANRLGDRSSPASATSTTASPTTMLDAGTPDAPTSSSSDSDQDVTEPPSEGQLASGATVQGDQSAEMPRATVRPTSELLSDVDQELAALFGNKPIEEVIQSASPAVEALELESRVRAQVLRADRENVFFALGGRNQGVAPVKQFKEPPVPGSTVEVVIRSYDAEHDLYHVVVPGAAQQVGDWDDLAEGTVVEARVTGANTGGLECMVNHIRGFIPASQIALYRVEHLTEYIGQRLLCLVTEVNPKKRKLVLSRRAILEREKEEARQARLNALNEGDVVEGTVRSIQKFGVFVDLGGLDGLIHVSQLSWDFVTDPAQVVEVGQRVRVRIEKIDRQTGKIGLSLRSLQEHPWQRAAQMFPVGAVVKGTVHRLAKFGAFVKLAPGIEGLLHISELSHQRVANVASVLQEGQELLVKVISLDVENQRIGLSLKALETPPPVEAEPREEPAQSQVPAKPQAPKRPPLKGGIDRSSGGDRFGLKW
jgi:predicted RNA-binding protein with RPS1 domain